MFDLGAELIAKQIVAGLQDEPGRERVDNLVRKGTEPDLTAGLARVGSQRHTGYVDSRAYESALIDLGRTETDG